MGWWVSAKHGDKVVCVNDDWTDKSDESAPKRGSVHTLNCVSISSSHAFHDCNAYITLIGCGRYYSALCFRPVTPKSTETGMKIIRSILDRAPVKEEA